MEKVLEKKIIKKQIKKEESKVIKPFKEDAIEKLTLLNGTLVEKVQVLFGEIDDIKNRLDQVASRLGL
jgi:hypothetical protein